MYHFIVNPHSRSGLGGSIWHTVEQYLKEHQIAYDVSFTKYQGQATKIAATLTANPVETTIVALGGDGTVNEVLNGLQNIPYLTFGYIPCGSSNDFSRSLKMPTDPEAAIQNIITAKHTKSVDIGQMHYKGKERRFAVSCGIGFDAAICHEAVVSKLKIFLNKLHLGKLTYVCIAFHQLFCSTPCECQIIDESGETYSFHQTYFAAVMNHPFEGGGCKFCPKADPCDGTLDLIVVSNLSKGKILCLLPLVFPGFHTRFKAVTILKGKQFSISMERPLAVHTDGEPVFLQKEIQVSLHPEQLRVIV